ncbi:hypothetical protein [Bradyrhizobium japonicum]|uniref:hypothetical protein n=1 Tax=Bradyrhizobium japonicum TaxID=375 RepID=UPI000AED21BB|nr:hypothetical protein [Bradyrhizobium japonicum]MCD9106063.1 hypothetical protein [Bradyrhizobium japonicum]MCD9259474.1 hypothetical protein [Bradyrhizobium japonicum SEMIA 5079]MCD9817192.1 hypothetical protein [Bradyrhizobium japonicum]MCD9890293.1 hypothetical protein [Bradyrhizobium japonicum]MCD9904800.1 hypothetical protein [Bradyrhizobium japonicum]
MKKTQPDEQAYREMEEAVKELAAAGLIYDTGQRRWSERTKSYQVVWAAVPPENERS